MGELALVADGLTPQDDYSFLPPGVIGWGFYVGKPSIGAWTRQQVAHLEATGMIGVPIWTPGDGNTYTLAEAQADAAAMLAGLRTLGITDGRLVILDIEHDRWVNTPTQTEHAAASWCAIMRASGWPLANWYGPCGSTAGWRACWGSPRPVVLPPGAIGVQYDHGLSGDRFDISVFDSSLFGGNDMPTAEEIAAAQWGFLERDTVHNGPLQPIGQYVANVNGRIVDVTAALSDVNAALSQTNSLLAQILAKLPAPPAPPV